jgi:hypothetical protein
LFSGSPSTCLKQLFLFPCSKTLQAQHNNDYQIALSRQI